MEQQIRQIFEACGDSEEKLLTALDTLGRQHGDEVYQEAFRFLLRRDFDAQRAGRYWREALVRWDSTSRVKGGQLRVRAALLDYLHNVVGEKLTSVHDGLTGLYNWAYARNYAEKLLVYLRRSKSDAPLALLLLNLDAFRQYNDLNGHMEGDRALRQVADVLRRHVREMDVAARYDGGDFAIVLPNSDRTQAFAVAERIRATVEKAVFAGQERLDGGNLTLSCGLASFPEDGESAQSLVRAASCALAEAKKERNGICPQRQDRRREQRRKVFSVVEVARANESPYFTAMAFDISSNGIALGCDAEVATGSDLQIRFRRPFWPQDREVPGTVRQARRDAASGVLHLGLEFAAPAADLSRPLAVSV